MGGDADLEQPREDMRAIVLFSLRLAGSPHRASPWGLLLSAQDWLHVGHLFDMLITFQINRKARLGLAHRNARNAQSGCSRVPHGLRVFYEVSF